MGLFCLCCGASSTVGDDPSGSKGSQGTTVTTPLVTNPAATPNNLSLQQQNRHPTDASAVYKTTDTGGQQQRDSLPVVRAVPPDVLQGVPTSLHTSDTHAGLLTPHVTGQSSLHSLVQQEVHLPSDLQQGGPPTPEGDGTPHPPTSLRLSLAEEHEPPQPIALSNNATIQHRHPIQQTQQACEPEKALDNLQTHHDSSGHAVRGVDSVHTGEMDAQQVASQAAVAPSGAASPIVPEGRADVDVDAEDMASIWELVDPSSVSRRMPRSIVTAGAAKALAEITAHKAAAAEAPVVAELRSFVRAISLTVAGSTASLTTALSGAQQDAGEKRFSSPEQSFDSKTGGNSRQQLEQEMQQHAIHTRATSLTGRSSSASSQFQDALSMPPSPSALSVAHSNAPSTPSTRPASTDGAGSWPVVTSPRRQPINPPTEVQSFALPVVPEVTASRAASSSTSGSVVLPVLADPTAANKGLPGALSGAPQGPQEPAQQLQAHPLQDLLNTSQESLASHTEGHITSHSSSSGYSRGQDTSEAPGSSGKGPFKTASMHGNLATPFATANELRQRSEGLLRPMAGPPGEASPLPAGNGLPEWVAAQNSSNSHSGTAVQANSGRCTQTVLPAQSASLPVAALVGSPSHRSSSRQHSLDGEKRRWSLTGRHKEGVSSPKHHEGHHSTFENLQRLSRKVSDVVAHAVDAAIHPHHHHQPSNEKATAQGTATVVLDAKRQQFLHAYDTGVLALLNALYGSGAGHMAALPLLPVAPWNRQSGYLGHLSTEQASALAKLRSTFPESIHFHSDHDLLRFLRARDFVMEDTIAMYTKYLKVFRGTGLVTPYPNVRPILGPLFKLELLQKLPERDAALTRRFKLCFKHFLHVVLCGTDNEGRPVIYMRPANILKRHMSDFVSLQDRVALQCASIESTRLLCHMASKAKGYHIEEAVHVMDLSGLMPMGMIQHMRSAETKTEFEYSMDFAPESLSKVIVINAPIGMSAVWTVASMFLPPKTTQKFHILGRGYQKDLHRLVGRQNVPTCYGGAIPFDWPEHASTNGLKY